MNVGGRTGLVEHSPLPPLHHWKRAFRPFESCDRRLERCARLQPHSARFAARKRPRRARRNPGRCLGCDSAALAQDDPKISVMADSSPAHSFWALLSRAGTPDLCLIDKVLRTDTFGAFILATHIEGAVPSASRTVPSKFCRDAWSKDGCARREVMQTSSRMRGGGRQTAIAPRASCAGRSLKGMDTSNDK